MAGMVLGILSYKFWGSFGSSQQRSMAAMHVAMRCLRGQSDRIFAFAPERATCYSRTAVHRAVQLYYSTTCSYYGTTVL
jgi:hypothetical protein